MGGGGCRLPLAAAACPPALRLASVGRAEGGRRSDISRRWRMLANAHITICSWAVLFSWLLPRSAVRAPPCRSLHTARCKSWCHQRGAGGGSLHVAPPGTRGQCRGRAALRRTSRNAACTPTLPPDASAHDRCAPASGQRESKVYRGVSCYAQMGVRRAANLKPSLPPAVESWIRPISRPAAKAVGALSIMASMQSLASGPAGP